MDQKGYYAIIPANVRYDEKLTPNAKLLYGEITALCNDKGFCWAGNQYFADLYGVSTVSISKWVSNLKAGGYIEIQMNYKENSKQILNRYIRLMDGGIKENFDTLLKKSLTPSQRKVKDPIKEKFKDNNTSNNTFNSTGGSSRFAPPTLDELVNYCGEKGYTSDPQAFIDYHTSRGWLVGRSKMVSWQAAFATWERNQKKWDKENANKQSSQQRNAEYASLNNNYAKSIKML